MGFQTGKVMFESLSTQRVTGLGSSAASSQGMCYRVNPTLGLPHASKIPAEEKLHSANQTVPWELAACCSHLSCISRSHSRRGTRGCGAPRWAQRPPGCLGEQDCSWGGQHRPCCTF